MRIHGSVGSAVVLEDMVSVSWIWKSLGLVTKVLGLGLDKRVSVLVLRQKSCEFKTSNFFDCSSSVYFRSVIDCLILSRIKPIFVGIQFNYNYSINHLLMRVLVTYYVDLIA